MAWHGGPPDETAVSSWLDAADFRPGAALAPSDRLLLTLLKRAIVADPAVERLLTVTRQLLLARIGSGERPARLVPLACALAHQGGLTEYVFAETLEEQAPVGRLRAAVETALTAGEPVRPETLDVALLGAYQPLAAVAGIGRLLEAEVAAPLASLLDRQVREWHAIRAVVPTIARLTPIDPSSEPVRAQYEDNPYPRWLDVPHVPSARLPAVLGTLFPHAALPDRLTRAPAILIAGCGTGRHTVETAQRFADARVTAIDLSIASLAYASYRSRTLGLDAIEYGQADILEIRRLGRRFDVIEAVGVLHHMADPIEGWRALRDVLEPDGVMKIGLYSARARSHIVRAHARIASEGIAPRPHEIRAFRQRLFGGPDREAVERLSESPDFYSISGCRDLLFHTREHRFSLPEIARMIDALGLDLIGLEVPEGTRRAFAARFRDPRAPADLAAWDDFEVSHPDTFRGMYQLWLRRA